MVYSVTHDKVNDLRSEFSTEMMNTLSTKLSNFGVKVMNVKVTDVQQPRELQERLERTTAFKTRLKEEAKNHEYAIQQLENTAEQRMAEITQQFRLEKHKNNASKDQYEINMDEAMNQARSERNVAVENAKGRMEIEVTKAKGEIEVAEYQGRSHKNELVSSTQIKCERNLREAQQKARMDCKAAEAEKNASMNMAKAREAEAEAQGRSAIQLEEKRKFEQRLRLAEVHRLIFATVRTNIKPSPRETKLRTRPALNDRHGRDEGTHN